MLTLAWPARSLTTLTLSGVIGTNENGPTAGQGQLGRPPRAKQHRQVNPTPAREAVVSGGPQGRGSTTVIYNSEPIRGPGIVIALDLSGSSRRSHPTIILRSGLAATRNRCGARVIERSDERPDK